MPERRESRSGVSPRSFSAAPSPKDKLGFGVYVDALAEFLLHENTKPPSTVFIEGDWGSGKTTFMRLLRDRPKTSSANVVWFKPWRRDKEESPWGAFAMTFVAELSAGLGRWRSRWAAFKVVLARPVTWPLLRFMGFLCLSCLVGYLLWLLIPADALSQPDPGGTALSGEPAHSVLRGVLSALPPFAWVILNALGPVKRAFGNPLTPELRRYFKVADYTDRVTFVERFHQDFRKVVQADVAAATSFPSN